ncbi:divergent polysaccharide deacetylase family protein [Hazenella sp. IB182357]|uniref:Divergent polysaccharide deacetylase family protein n=1 Tax=Polycladospora coralii TaxID=2771432 RepID=A0A926NB30_9BACL|nr:divergent polysaccharide deacetylase family protein [Polycladospora coralii]MBD1373611.1 divergent polysaccharide deacetylase family protein [Polycladospora coralii]MBS7529654.1 divergent polysaccharide deacetylase family protein [Polycladospora coralii]
MRTDYRKQILMLVLCVFFLCTPMSTSYALSSSPKKVAIIIDDFGNNLKGSKAFFSIQAPLTVAIMPFLKTSTEDAQKAHEAGFEVILHLPMEPVRGKKSWLGPGAITTDMTSEEIKNTLRKDLDSLPHVVGINNHMGSKATADERVVKAILEVLKERDLFIIDSLTSTHSKIEKLAKEMQVPYKRRTLFLDNQNSKSAISNQYQLLIKRTLNQGWGIAIGHVGHQGINTYEATTDVLTQFKKEQIELVHVSEIVSPSKH